MVLIDMKALEHLMAFFTRRGLLLGAIDQPSDLKTQINRIHAAAYLRITGKRLRTVNIMASDKTAKTLDNLSDGLSPSRRLARRRI
ncbi:MAG: hypothetical protein KAU89_07955 [Candidatus Thorarchaeota archaeon]|nr:hypothetical protein [Candidatus Thorarchaeota archaeon]